MAEKSLADYIKSMSQKGYDSSSIRNILLRYGYSQRDIDSAMGSATSHTIRHEIHLSHTTALVIIFLIVSAVGAVSLIYHSPSKTPSKLLDLNLEPVATTVEAGQNIVFLKELSNLGSSERYDVVIKQDLIDPLTSRIITQKIETRAIETFGSTQTRILVPKEAKPGDYILRAVVEYGDKKAIATLPVKIVSFAAETCFDGIKNQDESSADCGGACKPCETQAIECDDNNQCTNDVVENGACINKPIAPCCGNKVCEAEEQGSCSADCIKIEQPAISSETLDDIKELARVDPAKALQQCMRQELPDYKDECISNIAEVQRSKGYCPQITSPRARDVCYLNIAKLANDNSICRDISTEGRRDSCYMTFVLDNKDYSVCGSITNKQLRQSCESLRQLNDLNQASQNQAEIS
ncbi:hypothetical protein HYT53_03745 [Candidatus Woesearchaeota archaeon]|nr:hypothetical protein [Candidatus Woesearchaeota archaeon]